MANLIIPTSGILTFSFVADKFNSAQDLDAMFNASRPASIPAGTKAVFPDDFYGVAYLGFSSLSESVGNGSGFIDYIMVVNRAWTVTSNAAWLTLNKASGAGGNTTLRATYTGNIGAVRTATITLTAGGESVTTTVSQAAVTAAPFIILSENGVGFNDAARSFNVGVDSNTSWTVSDNASWISVSPTSGTNDGTITVTLQANTTTSERGGTVTVSGAGQSDSFSVAQSGGTAPMVTYYRLNQCGSGGTFYTTVTGTASGRAISPDTGTYYTYTGTSITQSTPPTGNLNNIQVIFGQFGCP